MATVDLEYRNPTGCRFKDLTGKQFGKLTVIRFVGFKKAFACFECKCNSCGRLSVRRGTHLSVRQDVACSCSRIANGLAQLPEYGIWRNMLRRCCTPTDPAFAHYGGRGISVCERWALSFDDFYSDMGPRPSQRHSIDRIDNDGNYEPDNCRWATKKEQANNTRKNVLLTYKGRTQSASAWAAELGLSRQRIEQRLNKMPVDVALSYGRGESSPVNAARLAAAAAGKEEKQKLASEAAAVRDRLRREKQKSLSAGRLSHAERKVRRQDMALAVASGTSRHEVAAMFGVSLPTVDSAIQEFPTS